MILSRFFLSSSSVLSRLVVLLLTLASNAVSVTEASRAASTSSSTSAGKRLRLDTIYAGLKEMEYAVRGKVVLAADALNQQLKTNNDDDKSLPFDHIVYTNIGNPHSVGQSPLTWPRQVLALVDLPPAQGVNHPLVHKLFPKDAIARAKLIHQQLNGHGTGAYTHSKGIQAFRQDIADFLLDRDGPEIAVDVNDIYLTNGASAGIAMVLQTLIAGPKCGILIPIPQYPLYSATIDLLQGQKVGYYLDEADGWALNVAELERAYKEATAKRIEVRALVVINPGNPSGSVLTRDNLHAIVKFCAKHKLVLLADEVYQENVYDETAEFVSCKKAAYETGLLQDNAIELVSFHSTSKGVWGECGRRGGYMELVGIDEGVKDMMYKMASAFLCSSTAGQIMTSLMVKGPQPGDVSYASHEREKRAIWESLKRRSQLVSSGLDKIPGFSCQPATGSMYCFPSITLPDSVIRAAAQAQMPPDTFYAVDLLEHTGICVVPASGFGQAAGRFGFRTTFLPPEDEMIQAVEKIQTHYQDFCQKYEN